MKPETQEHELHRHKKYLLTFVLVLFIYSDVVDADPVGPAIPARGR